MTTNNSDRELLSVVVLTYNSASTVIDTLNSVRDQNYDALELIVCDDYSTDSTADMVTNWLASHGHEFRRAVFLPSLKNEGTCKNLKRGYAAARGQWLKPIAGDDLFKPGAIQRFAKAASSSSADIIFSRMETFGGAPPGSDARGTILPVSDDMALIAGNDRHLLQELVRRNFVPAPSALLRRSAYEAVGGIDLDFRNMDDWPLWMRFAIAGKAFQVLPDVLVGYRISAASISYKLPATQVNVHYLQDIITFYEKYQNGRLPFPQNVDRAIDVFRWKLAKGALRNHPRVYKLTRFLYILSPHAWSNIASRWK